MRRIAFVLCTAACGSDDPMTFADAAPCVDTGHDEDGDGIGDACDICPAAPDPAQRDTTEAATMLAFPDGVGDACDPRGRTSGDKLGAFESFVDPATSDRWTGTGWTIENDLARASGTARWIAKTRAAGDGLYAQARITQLAWQPTGVFELILDGDGVNTGLGCAIAKDRDGDGSDEIDAREVGVATVTKSVGMEITGAIKLSSWRIIDSMQTGLLRCQLTFEGGSALIDLPLFEGIAIGFYGFSNLDSATDVSSIVVYTSPALPVEKD